MPAVAVTSAQGAYAYIVALKGFSVGCQPSLLLISVATGKTMGFSFFGFGFSFPTTPNHPFASAEVVLKLGRDLRYKTESTTVICAFFLKKKTSRSDLCRLHDGLVFQFAPTNLIGMCTRKGAPSDRESSDSTFQDASFKTLPRQVDPYTKHSGSKHVSGRPFFTFGLRMAELIDLVCHFPHHPGFMCCNCVIELGIPHRPRKEVALRDGTLLAMFLCWASFLQVLGEWNSFLRVGFPYRPHFLRQ